MAIYRRSWVEEAEYFQSLPKEEQEKWCSQCRCTSGCSLCKDLSKIKLEEIVDDDALYEYLHRDIAQG